MFPSPPKPGEIFEYRAIGYVLATVQHGKRQIRWEDNSTSHTDHPDIMNYNVNQRFECMLRYTYTGTNPKDLFEKTGPILLAPKPIENYTGDKDFDKSCLDLWNTIMTREKTNQDMPQPPVELDEDFWFKQHGDDKK